MTRTLAFLVVLIAGCLLLVAITSASTPTRYRPLSESQFHSLSDGLPQWQREQSEGLSSPGSSPGPVTTPSQRPTVGPSATNSPEPLYRPKPTATPVVGRLSGSATWWDSWGPGLYAAAGGRLRAAMGPSYLHRYVTACSRAICVRVRLTTSCACVPNSRVIDLSLDAFSKLADPSLGVIAIVIEW